jgi:UrcA family protein
MTIAASDDLQVATIESPFIMQWRNAYMISKHYRQHLRSPVLCTLFALAITSGSLGTVYAADAPTIKVSYSDLDLSRPADAQVLYRRLKQAAAAVCGSSVSAAELLRYAHWRRCYDPALHNAVMQIDAPELLTRYRSDPSNDHARG